MSEVKNQCLDAVKMNEHYNKYSVKMIYVTLYYNIYIFFYTFTQEFLDINF